MFAHIVERYEWFDHVASLGNDYLWRPRALWELDRFRAGAPVRRALDVGSGTGQLARLVSRHFPESRVVAADFTRAMVRHARGASPREEGRLGFARANALRLPFRDGTFDLVTNAFLARNLADLEVAFAEMRRVLRPGGTLLTLEVTEPDSPTFARFFHAYFDRVVPSLGALVASAGPYRYLPESLKSLPGRSALVDVFRRAGFPRTVACPQSLGIVTTFLAEAGAGRDQSR